MLFQLARFVFLAFFFFNLPGCSTADKTPLSSTAHTSSGFAIKGISMVAPVKQIDEIALQPIVNVHANSISVMPYAFCSPENPVIKYNNKGQWWGESDSGVIGSIQLAHKKKLAVMLKPHLWLGHGTYTGAFSLKTEKEWLAWESSYSEFILHFAVLADSMKAEIFCIGTELGAAVKHRLAYWNSLIDTINHVFHGKLTYAANWDDYKDFPFWKKLNYIGIDAYFPLSNDKTPITNSLENAWTKYTRELETISVNQNRPILFTEYGYRNVDFNCIEPWKENDGNQNDEAQTNALEAFYRSFAKKKWFSGGFVWKWYVDSGHHHKKEIDFTPQNKNAEKVIENWYRN